MKRKFFFGMRVPLYIRGSSIVEKRALLREGNSIAENKFSYDKEVSMDNELFSEKEVERKFYCETAVLLWQKGVLSWEGSSVMEQVSF